MSNRPDGQLRYWLPSPPSVNELFRNSMAGDRRGGRIPTESYITWERQAKQELMAQKARSLRGPVTLAFFFGERSPLADVSNFIKAPEDLLVSMHVIEGDSRKIVQGISACWVPSYHGCVVHITPWRESEPLWLGFDAGVLGQIGASDPRKMGLHPSALGRMRKLAGKGPAKVKKPKII